MEDFYVFEVIESYSNAMFNENFDKGIRFIGWEGKGGFRVDSNVFAFKSNSPTLECIPIENVKKVFKIKFEELNSSNINNIEHIEKCVNTIHSSSGIPSNSLNK